MPITRTLARGIGNYRDERSLGSNLRRQRLAPLLEMIDNVYEARGAVSIIDVGGTEDYWNIVPKSYLDQRNVAITIVNLPSWRQPKDHGLFRFVDGDGCDLSEHEDRSFDVAHSNSVLEHVGDHDRMVRFASEVSRVANGYFIQTPNFWFPIEPHAMTPFFHWLPRRMRVALVSHFQLGYWSKATCREHAERIVDSARLLDRKAMNELFPDAEIVTEKLIGLPKSFVAVRRPILTHDDAGAEPSLTPQTAAGGA